MVKTSNKIAHIYYGLNIGGIEQLIIDLISNQINHYEVVDVICINTISLDNLSRSIPESVNLIMLNRVVGSKSISPYAKLFGLLILNNYDILHVHSAQIAKLPVFAFFRSRLVVHVHALNHICSGDFPECAKILAVSNTVKHHIQRHYGEREIITVYNGVNFDAIRKRTHDAKTRQLICVGALVDDVKRQRSLIDELSEIIIKEDLRLHFVGGGPDLGMLQDLVEDLGLTDYIYFLGNKPRVWIMQNLCNFDAFLHGSISEGFNLSAVEAAAAGLPLFLSDIPAHREISDNTTFVCLYDHARKGSLTKYLSDFYKDDMCNVDHDRTSSHEYESKFGIENFYKNIDELYREILIKRK